MSDRAFIRRLEQAAQVAWETPPSSAHKDARQLPVGTPPPPAPPGSPDDTIFPSDVRAGTGLDPTGIVHRSFPGLDVTVMLQPPRGDELSLLRGRAWPEDASQERIRVLLVQGDHVLAEQWIAHGGRFEFAEVLVGDWSIEFHWGDRAVVLRGGPR